MEITKVPDEFYFKGRSGDPRLGEWVKKEFPQKSKMKSKTPIVSCFGCPDDLGILLNLGRAGAKEGPNTIRKYFYKMPVPYHWNGIFELYDTGNISVFGELKKTHLQALSHASEISKNSNVIFVAGGGHDFVAPCFSGFAEGKKGRLGLINIDPHLDVREKENGEAHSGTGFRVLLDSKIIEGKNLFQFGAKTSRNSTSHWNYCKEKKVNLIPFENIREKKSVELFKTCLSKLQKQTDTIGLSLDMDSCSEAEGVSAPSTIGFSAWELSQFAKAAGANKKVGYFEIAEVSPALDPSHRSARIAAEVFYSFLEGFVSRFNTKK
jgi:formiminoglutamase